MSIPPDEGWILAGVLDEQPAAATLGMVAGMPLLLRHACELRRAGIRHILLIWVGPSAGTPDFDLLTADDRLSDCSLELVHEVPSSTGGDVLVVRSDRVFHRDLYNLLTRSAETALLRKIAGDNYDGVFAAERATASALAKAAYAPRGLANLFADMADRGEINEIPPPPRSFCVPARDRAGLRRGERLLVSSLRKDADGYAARVLNRHVSLFITRFLMHTPVRPNHMTVLAFVAALTGGIIIGHGGYLAGVVGMLLVELGSILDGIDGEIARLKCRFSRLGQWMDTVTDDISNVCYWTGTMMSLRAAGIEWALPVWAVTVTAFAITQSVQYYLIAVVYKSGDLAAIPWALQSTEFLSSRPTKLLPRIKAGLPKFLKRDFAVSLFLIFAIAGRLDAILLVSAVGAVVFLFTFTVQFVRAGPDRAALRRAT